MATDDSKGAEGEARLNAAVAACLDSMDSGGEPDRAALLARYPEFADELAEFLSGRQQLERLARPIREVVRATRPGSSTEEPKVTHAETAAGAAPPPLRSFGDYEVLEELAHGGMGVVYKARQKSLNRLMALKVIRAGELASKGEIQRFRNEAETVALLDHPHIVPVYEVGEHDGQLYFSMKLVEGGSLAGQLDRFKDDPKAAARLLITVARAVHHAHQRGILHRDLKPSNILLDQERQPHVTDFGLAKRVETDSSLTQSGAIVGTPSYMAPEQAAGQKGAVTIATDIYGLGAVLYALLTARPPFQGATVLETLEHVKHREPEHPNTSGRRVDGDLDTICLKCLQKDPPRRYGSALELAQDLERWLAGEPIQARPVSVPIRLWRWCRRNRLVAGLTGSSVVLLFALICGLTTSALWVAQERDEAKANFHAAERARAEAVANLGEAAAQRKRTDKLLATALFEAWWADGPLSRAAQAGSPKKEDEVPRVLKYVHSFHDQGWSAYQEGQYQAAEAHFRKALTLEQTLALKYPHLPVCIALAETNEGLAILLEDQCRHVEEEQALRQGLGFAKEASAFFPDEAECQLRLTSQYHLLAGVLEKRGRFDEAAQLYRDCHSFCTQLVSRLPRKVVFWTDLGVSQERLGDLLFQRGRLDEAEQAYQSALQLWQKAAPLFPDQPVVRSDLAHIHLKRGNLLAITKRPQGAERAYRKAIRVLKTLRREEAVSYSATGRDPIWSTMLYAPQLAWTYTSLANLFRNMGRPEQALMAYRQALTVLNELDNDRVPQTWSGRQDLAWFLCTCPDPAYRNPRRALALGKRTAVALEQAKRELGRRRELATCWRVQGVASYRAGDWKGCLTALQRSLQLRAGGDSCDWFFLSMASWQLGDEKQARQWQEKAVRWMDKNKGYDEELARFRTEAAELFARKDRAKRPGEEATAGKQRQP